MTSYFFHLLELADTFFWGYIGFALIACLGIYLTISTNFFQIRAIPSVFKTFIGFLRQQSQSERGVDPIKIFFASVGGMIGIGNIVGITTAIQLGGPGALFWVWVTGIIGSLVKYSEVYLGLKYRVPNDKGGYDGGPMYFLRQAFDYRFVSVAVCFMLCIYGIEPYQFAVITDTLSTNWNLNRYFVIITLLSLVLYAGSGGVPRVAKICSRVLPFFMIAYVSMSLWVILHHTLEIPQILLNVFTSAFTGHAAIGGFVGSTMILAIKNGLSSAAYSGDIGVGYDSIIQSESKTIYPERQARLAILGVWLDNLICTMSILVVLTTGIWKNTYVEGSMLVQNALSEYFPFMHIFMPTLLFIVGYSTLIAYFCVGLKCSHYLHPRYGKPLFYLYGVFTLVFFSFHDQTKALLLMRLVGALLLITNLVGIFFLRDKVAYTLEEEYAPSLEERT
ncbi:Amino-acid carrier protein AlsT [Candidatus Rubidus massiliensis]|nr:MAG: sodium/alanine symporter protein [Chlamydia sp. 32-24]CDZ80613.1 Amino-acid carrier protein AlsT [Candidatus Rubidus massiliensis]